MWRNKSGDEHEEKNVVKENGEIDMRIILESAIRLEAMSSERRIRFTKNSYSRN